MKKLNQLAATLILLSCVGCTNVQRGNNGGDHLEPVRGIYEIYDFQFEYDLKVRKVLFDGLSDSPEVRFQVMPSFTPENVLDIEFDRVKNKYYLIYHICEKIIWYSDEDLENVKVSKFKAEIDKKSVDLIKSLFGTAISQVKFPPTIKEGEMISVGLDGENYFFTINEYGYGIKSGTVWSPNKGSKMDKLITIGNQLIELAMSKKEIVTIDETTCKEIKKLISEIK